MNLIDVLILGFLSYFIWSGYENGLTMGLLNLVRTAAAFFLSLIYYPEVGSYLSNQFSLAKSVGQILAFIIILIIVEVVLGFLLAKIHTGVFKVLFRFRPFYLADKLLGIIPSVLIGLILLITFTLLPLILPVAKGLKEPVEQSWWGKHVLPSAVAFEPALEGLLQRLPTRNLIYIVTQNPESEESIPIDVPSTVPLTINKADEEAMLKLLNSERVSRGLTPLIMDQTLVEVARKHSEDMFRRGYFSHHNPDGETPFDRMDEGGVVYDMAGENLAYAPTVEIAHQGLMNSKGHRENILKNGYGRVGIGVIDAGFYGKMYTQNFAD